MNKNSKVFLCRTLKLMQYLSDNGQIYFKTMNNKDIPHYKVWLYKKTDQLDYLIDKYFNELN